MKRCWKLYKNVDAECPCWQIYYIEDDGRKRFFDEALTYPVAAALRDALEDDEIRHYVVDHTHQPIMNLYAHRMANKAAYDAMNALTPKYDKNADRLYEALVMRAIDSE